MFEDLGPLRDSIRDVILTSDVDMGMIRLTQIAAPGQRQNNHQATPTSSLREAVAHSDSSSRALAHTFVSQDLVLLGAP